VVPIVAQELEEPVEHLVQLGMALEVLMTLIPREVMTGLVAMAKESRESLILTIFLKEERGLTE
jgi:hypothetical protein